MAGLSLIGTYSSDSDNEEETVTANAQISKAEISLERLPLPQSIKSWKGVTHHEEVFDDPSEHGGRVRSFKHERGNWATLVYIEYIGNDSVRSWMKGVPAQLGLNGVHLLEECHISLTRSLILKFHWIESFAESVRKLCQNTDRFAVELASVKVYCNEDRTRTFLGICCREDSKSLEDLVVALDKLLAEYKLPPFYEDASFHVSFLWCLGDEEERLNACLPFLNNSLNNLLVHDPAENHINITRINCKIGNKMYTFPLK